MGKYASYVLAIFTAALVQTGLGQQCGVSTILDEFTPAPGASNVRVLGIQELSLSYQTSSKTLHFTSLTLHNVKCEAGGLFGLRIYSTGSTVLLERAESIKYACTPGLTGDLIVSAPANKIVELKAGTYYTFSIIDTLDPRGGLSFDAFTGDPHPRTRYFTVQHINEQLDVQFTMEGKVACTDAPTFAPTKQPSASPTPQPTLSPTTGSPTFSPTLSPTTRAAGFCGAGSTNCDIRPINYRAGSWIQVDNNATANWDGVGEVFETVMSFDVSSNVGVLTPYTFITDGAAVDCASILAIFRSGDTFTYSRPLSDGPSTRECFVDWSGVFETPQQLADLSPDATVYFAFRDLSIVRQDGLDEPFRMSLTARTGAAILFSADVPVFTVNEFSAAIDPATKDLAMRVHLLKNPATTCVNYDSISDISVVVGTCTGVPIVSNKSSTSSSGEAYFDFIVPRATVTACSSGSGTDPNTGALVEVFDLAFTAAGLPAECTPTVPLDHEQREFTLRTFAGSTNVDVVEEVNTVVDGAVIMRALGHRIIPCNGRVEPMGRVEVFVETRSSDPLANKTYGAASLDLGAVPLTRNDTFHSCNIDALTGEYVCLDSYATQECLQVTSNSGGCALTYIGVLDIPVEYALSSGQNVSAELTNPFLRSQTFPAADCPVVSAQNDVTIQVPVKLQFLESDNALENIAVSIEFMDLDDSADITLQIENVRVTVGDVVRMFDINDKKALMGFEGSGYYNNVHFCRQIPENGDGSICTAFYDEGEPSRSNAFTLANVATYHIAERGYSGCQLIQERASDRWMFSPQNWGFADLLRTVTNDVNVRVVAKVRDCATTPGNDGNSARRMLAAEDDTVVVESTITVNPDGSITIVPGGDGIVKVEDKTNNVLLISVLVVILFAMFAVGIYFSVGYYKRRGARSSDHGPADDNKDLSRV